MRILIVSPYFYPFENPRAHRWTSIAMEWARLGHTVDVLTSAKTTASESILSDKIELFPVGQASLREWSGNPDSVFRQKLLEVGKWFFKLWVWPDSSMYWIKPAQKKIDKLLSDYNYDLVVSVSLPFSSHLVVLPHQSKHDFKWIVDVGDPFIQNSDFLINNRFIYSKKNERTERQVMEAADVVCVTTDSLKAHYENRYELKSVRVIGPIASSKLPVAEKEKLEEGITIGYFGSLYDHVRTAEVLRPFLDHLGGLDLRNTIRLDFYGYYRQGVVDQIKKMGEKSGCSIRFYDWIEREKVIDYMSKKTFLLSLGNNSNLQLPSKVIDYFAARRPIIHINVVDKDPVINMLEAHNCKLIWPTEITLTEVFLKTRRTDWLDVGIAQQALSDYGAENAAKKYLSTI